jgi:hypothetical protein
MHGCRATMSGSILTDSHRLVATGMQNTMVGAAKRQRELVADPTARRARLCKSRNSTPPCRRSWPSIRGRGGSTPNRRRGSPNETQRQNLFSAVRSRC